MIIELIIYRTNVNGKVEEGRSSAYLRIYQIENILKKGQVKTNKNKRAHMNRQCE